MANRRCKKKYRNREQPVAPFVSDPSQPVYIHQSQFPQPVGHLQANAHRSFEHGRPDPQGGFAVPGPMTTHPQMEASPMILTNAMQMDHQRRDMENYRLQLERYRFPDPHPVYEAPGLAPNGPSGSQQVYEAHGLVANGAQPMYEAPGLTAGGPPQQPMYEAPGPVLNGPGYCGGALSYSGVPSAQLGYAMPEEALGPMIGADEISLGRKIVDDNGNTSIASTLRGDAPEFIPRNTSGPSPKKLHGHLIVSSI
ncbi:hypothetical protein BO71DRAFT_164619 [Aspergillus ellipticus CBS 707.79]|uniref:Uncharacterized protein n=1 Tax=Aspergillus ellipticus CBS 707.79 TaxID=1448320 RepID=A0A319DH11_9EURO|nr:hypothetical protein BO71DRAFT_164619 [Aspergillus ellipticus CBS 707.79]